HPWCSPHRNPVLSLRSGQTTPERATPLHPFSCRWQGPCPLAEGLQQVDRRLERPGARLDVLRHPLELGGPSWPAVLPPVRCIPTQRRDLPSQPTVGGLALDRRGEERHVSQVDASHGREARAVPRLRPTEEKPRRKLDP